VRRPLGCLTFSALIAAVLVTVAIFAIAAATGNGLFSPGQLSAAVQGAPLGGVTSHAELGSRCDACHAAPWTGERMTDRCLACHAQVKQEISTGGGLHGGFPSVTDCRTCHTDHRGVTASVTLANPSIVAHERLGFALSAHPLRELGGTFSCKDCHPSSVARFTTPTCATCHQELDSAAMAVHQDTFGSDCLNCHDGVDTYGKAYAHPTYPLVGAHQGAACKSCHSGGTTQAALRATSTECVACHAAKDTHQGRLGSSCGQCHTPQAWTGATINHDQTRYPLVGKHVGVQCESCHVNRQWSGIGTTCKSCHAATDPHGGQFAADCATCHAVTGWKDVTFDHATTKFALAGSHAGVACAACHADGKYVGTPTTCAACHAKPASHASSAFASSCTSCHSVSAWMPASFDHGTTSFKLTGAHYSLSCTKCHSGGTYTGAPSTCVGCHSRPSSHGSSAFSSDCASCHKTTTWIAWTFDHNKTSFKLTGAHYGLSCAKCHSGGSYAGTASTCVGCHAKPASHASSSAFSSVCTSCHSTKAWKPASFDHSKTTFKLTGAHYSLSCTKCHSGSKYTGTPSTCAACHTKPASHDSSFGSNCATCHSTKAWKPAGFDHSTTSFKLTGAHYSLSCAKCHPNGQYKGTPSTCLGCHSKPSSHSSSAFSNSCTNCHTTKAWKPATFDHSKTSFKLTGAHYSLSCAKCHPGGKYSGTPSTCVGCHSRPSSHGSAFSNDCAACHSTGAWKPADFDHSKASFKLTGAHLGVSCAKCHPGGKYAGTPSTCASCHSKPSSHGSGFGTDCASCHSTNAWKPASYNGPHTFPMTHGGAGGSCAKCHPSSYFAYSCTGCHSASSMNEHHKEVSGYSLTTCAKCHPKGRGGD
jgi:hypothetical protein